MDIRKFFTKRKNSDEDLPESQNKVRINLSYENLQTHTSALSTTEAHSVKIHPKDNMDLITSQEDDLGSFVNIKGLSDDKRQTFLEYSYEKFKNYNFKDDAVTKRAFRYAWLEEYYPWLTYSPMLKGALCKFCVLFPQPVTRGFQGAFITRAFEKYKDFNENARNHISSCWHKNSCIEANNFLAVRKAPSKQIICQIDNSVMREVEENRKKLFPILSTILFCGTHDIALRGKIKDSSNVSALYDFRIESGDNILKHHLENAPTNAKYTSVQTEHELIKLAENVIRQNIVNEANNAVGFSLLADESAEIAGKEQLSLGVRYIASDGTIKEEFLGFTCLSKFDAESIATTILKTLSEFGLNLNKMLGQGYDGCSVMAGKEKGVQAIIHKKYQKAFFVHCASHRLNLVVNDLNAVSEIRNASGTIKSIIKFFRESPKRRAMFPNVPLLSETRWTSKYKSIRIFSYNFSDIFHKLSELASTDVGKTRQDAYHLAAATSTPGFLYALIIIATYSAMLEPVTQMLQSVQLDLFKANDHIKSLLGILKIHRENPDLYFKNITTEVNALAKKQGINLTLPRICKKQIYRENIETDSVEDYYRKTVFIPYLDSIISSLETRFSSNSENYINLFALCPLNMKELNREEYLLKIEKNYEIDNLKAQASMWYDMWLAKCTDTTNTRINFIDCIQETDFVPAVKHAITIALTLPVSTATIERSFSSLRRVKTWLRATMCEERLSGLCMLSVHRAYVNKNKQCVMNEIINKFGESRRRLQFLFKT